MNIQIIDFLLIFFEMNNNCCSFLHTCDCITPCNCCQSTYQW